MFPQTPRPQSSQPPSLEQAVLLPRILLGAFAGGILMFSAVIAWMTFNAEPNPEPAPTPQTQEETADSLSLDRLLPIIGIGMTIGALAVTPVFRPRPIKQLDKASAQQFLTRFVSSKVLAGALAEGPGLFWVITVFMTKNPYYFFGAGFSILLLLREMPSRMQLENAAGVEYRDLESLLGTDDTSE